MVWNDFKMSYKFGYMEKKYFSVYFIRNHKLKVQKMVKLQLKNHQNDPLRNQNWQIFAPGTYDSQ